MASVPRFFVKPDGSYIGSYDGPDESLPPMFQGGVAVDVAPEDARQVWDGQKWLSVAPMPEMLTAELEWRLAAGFDFDFGDQRGIHHFGTTDADMKRWMQEVTPLAQAAMNMGEPNRQIGIKTDTGPTFVTASEWWRVLDAAADWRQPLYAAYFTLKALPQIPADYATNPAYWP
ncbi:hypothetical protein [Agrobacterium cavarae]|uniref:hypothetical protein n=1 Tax=Agrobacterium cavarae TaxID=2528239 RepID=UPI00289664F9|nr:hypothetical protein [Agrobacterium cavarae]